MPVYEYRCDNGHGFDVVQSMSEDPVQTCEVCGAPVERVMHSPAVHFKGSGFYATDYAGKGETGAEASNGADKAGSGESKGDSGESKAGSADSTGDSGASSGDSSSGDSSSSKDSSSSADKAKTGTSAD